MTDYILLILSVLAGGSVAMILGSNKAWDRILLSFSGAYLFSVIVLHLLPEIYRPSGFTAKTAGLFLLGGLLFQLLLDYFSHGIEHGHEQHHSHAIGPGAVAGLFIHAFTEGLPVHQLHSHAYLWAILVHKFPIALILTSFLIHAGLSKPKIWFFLIAFSLMSPLGAWTGTNVTVLEKYHVLVSAFVAGILTHVSTTILFESEEDHRIKKRKFTAILLAFLIAYLLQ